MSVRAENEFMQAAIEEACCGIEHRHGGPFGAVIVRDGRIIARGHNRVIANNDPTCHGEIDAIRRACSELAVYDLSGCELYTTGEPCPMCLFACMWANIERIFYGCTLEDNSKLGFRDSELNDIGNNREKLRDYLVCTDREPCLELFRTYAEKGHEIY